MLPLRHLLTPVARGVTAAAFLLAIVGCAVAQNEESPLSNDGGGATAVALFSNLNAPALPGKRGVANPRARLGTGPAVWETLKNSTEIFRVGGAPPCPWETICEIPDGTTPLDTKELRARFGPTNSTWLHYLSGNRMIDGQQVVDAHAVPIRYDVRCNREFYDYIAANPSKHPLYNIEGQEAARSDPKFQFEFPRNATEVKAAWKLLEKGEDDSRFWTAYGAYYDDDGKLQYSKIALTAFHIIRRDQFGWIFTTFEQIDNPKATYTYFLQEKQEAVGVNSTLNPEAAKYNALIEKRFQGTKWQHYRVMGWQTEETDADGRPVLLANTNIETYFPKTSSCKSCHAMANIGPNSNRRLNMWDMSNGIEGRVGNVDFQKIAKELAPGELFKQTDYAWVLREAQSVHATGQNKAK